MIGNKDVISAIRNFSQISGDIVDISEGRITLPYQKDFVVSGEDERDNLISYAQIAVETGLGEEYVCITEDDQSDASILRVRIELANELLVN